jgi:predicted RNA-binding Zn-ribbon protein involved in translation (DUF1610 family)
MNEITEVRFTSRRATKAPKRAPARKKQTLVGKLRAWGMPEGFQWSNLRYKSPFEKGIYWFYTSLFVRERDVANWGTCISCNKPITVETSQGGHYCPAGSCGRDLLFDERNVNAECPRCNAFDEGHLFGYEIGLDSRYGRGTAEGLKRRYKAYKDGEPVKDWSAKEYAQKIRDLWEKMGINPTLQ